MRHAKGCLDGKEMSGLRKSIDNNPNRIIPLRSLRKSSNEIHSNVLPCPRRNGQRLKSFGRLKMFGFLSLANIALGDVSSDLPLHTSPPKLLLEILIHLGTTRMNRE